MPSERISLLIDVITGNSKSSLNQLKTDLAAADTVGAKLKVGAKGIGDALKQNLGVVGPAAAAAAGVAIGKLLVKAGGDFEKLALRVGEFRDATGLAAEDASRFVEVASDLGIPVDTLQTAIGKLNKAAANTPEAFANIGAEIAKTKDGATDVNQTFLNTIDALNGIPDPIKRAAAAAQIFGRGWQQIAEIVGSGADDLKARLDAVSGGQIINDAQIAQARQFRDSLDDLHDSVEKVFNTIGSGLIPVMNDLIGIAKGVGAAIEAIPFKEQAVEVAGWVTGIKPLTMGLSKASDVMDDLTGTIHASTGEIFHAAGAMDDLELASSQAQAALDRQTAATKDQYESASEATQRLETMAAAQQAAAEAADAHRAALQRLADSVFSAEGAQLALEDAVADFRKTLHDTTGVLKDSESTTRQKSAALNDLRQSELAAAESAKSSAQAYADESGAAQGSAEHTMALKESLQASAAAYPFLREEIQAYIDRLNAIPSNVNTLVTTTYETRGATPLPGAGPGARASGGPVGAGQMYMVGEQGPELFVPGASGSIMSASATRGALSANGASRIQDLIRSAREHANLSRSLHDEAAALREQAKATEDSDRKQELLDEATKKSEQSINQWSKATADANKVSALREQALTREANALHRQSDALERQAAAAHTAAAGLSEQSASVLESDIAGITLRNARRDAAQVFADARAARASGTGVGAAADAAASAALNVANAAVQQRLEQAQRRGETLTQAQQIDIMRESLQRQARGLPPEIAGPILKILDDLAKARELAVAAAREEREARRTDRAAAEREREANRKDRDANRAGNVRPGVILNVNVTAPLGGNPDAFGRAVADGLGRYVRTNGAGPLRKLLGIP